MEAAEKAEDCAEIGRMVAMEESTSAEVCRVVAELAVAEVWRGGVEAAADEDAVWVVVLAGRAALQAARLSLREAAAEVQAGVEAEHTTWEARGSHRCHT